MHNAVDSLQANRPEATDPVAAVAGRRRPEELHIGQVCWPVGVPTGNISRVAENAGRDVPLDIATTGPLWNWRKQTGPPVR